MRSIMISYYDKKLGVYSSPSIIAEASDENIVEQTRRMCANPQMPKIYFEYDLYRLGAFDDKTGEFEIENKPVFLCSLDEYRHLASEVHEDVQS